MGEWLKTGLGCSDRPLHTIFLTLILRITTSQDTAIITASCMRPHDKFIGNLRRGRIPLLSSDHPTHYFAHVQIPLTRITEMNTIGVRNGERSKAFIFIFLMRNIMIAI